MTTRRLPSARALLLALLAAAAFAGCGKKTKQSQSLGAPLVQTPARNLAVSPDGATLAFVSEAAAPPEAGAPEGILQGILATVSVAGGPQRQLGGGVTTLDDGFRISPDGKWIAYLQAFRFREQSGTLCVAPMPTGDAKTLADGAKYYRFSKDGKWLGYVARQEMHLVELASGIDRRVAPLAATFEFSPDSKRLLVRRPVAAGGALLLVEAGPEAEPRELGGDVGEYDFSPDGASLAFTSRQGGPGEPYSLFVGPVGGQPRKVAEGASTFFFSPDGAWIAFVDGVGVNRSYGDLHVAAVAGGAPKKVGEAVQEHAWSPDSKTLAIKENHEDKAGKTWLAFKVVAIPQGEVIFKDDSVPNFLFSPDGSRLAFLKRILKPIYSVDLYLVELGEKPEARAVGAGVFNYQFSPSGRDLWFLTNCTRNGRECDLMSAPAAGAELPQRIVSGIWSFKPSVDGSRLLLTYPRFDTESAGDLGFLELGAAKPSRGIDQFAFPGAAFLDKSGRKVAYLVGERKREGVYLADLP